MIKITRKPDKAIEQDKDLVSADNVLTIIENNRSRIRTLSGTILNVCGLLLSTSFVVLFFILSDTKFLIALISPILIFSASACLVVSIIYSVLSVHLPSPVAVPTKLELIDVLTAIYHREYRKAVISVLFLIISIILFVGALISFGIGLL